MIKLLLILITNYLNVINVKNQLKFYIFAKKKI